MSDLQDFANKVCQYLPEEFDLDLHLENSSGSWELYHDGDRVPFEDYACVDDSLLQQGESALAYAIANAEDVSKGENQ